MALLVFLLAWGVTPVTPSGFCMDQLAGIEAAVGEDVTLPCQYAHPRDLGPVGEVHIYWLVGLGDRCTVYIYNHTENITHSNYTQRISLVGDPVGSQTLSIRITDLKNADSKRYCCRVVLLKPNSTGLLQQWQSPGGTFLRVRDKPKLRGYQPASILAMEGDSIIIPCKYTYTGSVHPTQSVSIEWAEGFDHNCGNRFFKPPKSLSSDQSPNQISMVIDPQENQMGSIRIYKVTTSDKHYCCKVTINKDQGGRKTWTRPYGTRLIVGGRNDNPGYTLLQPNKTVIQEGKNATISCKYSHPPSTYPYRIEVYWRVKMDQHEFVYHPDPELVHIRYRGRSYLIEDPLQKTMTTLQIENVTRSDNNTYYCLVEFRLCNSGSINNIVYIIKEGMGTNLEVEDTSGTKRATLQLQLAIGVTLLVLVIVGLAVLSWFIHQKKGRRHQENNLIASTPPNNEKIQTGEPVYSEVQSNQPTSSQGNDDNLVYASLDMEKSGKKTTKSNQEQDAETLYAAVRVNQ
ncbi:uncharacterized protein [Ambystoma mexicanum]|uniref:uncharacterized protein n=1 Tax=Ambystoma mexicanum TaxID=8296 RepID=UPI0037E77DDB